MKLYEIEKMVREEATSRLSEIAAPRHKEVGE